MIIKIISNANKETIFLTVGLLTFVIYYGLLFLFFDILACAYPYAIGFSYFLAVVFHFFANRKYTFRSSESGIRNQFLKYTVIALVNYIFQASVVMFLYEKLHFNFYISTFFAVASCTVIGYITLNKWVFGKAEI